MAEVVGGISGLTRKYLPVPQAADVGKYLKVDTNGNPVYYAETPGGVVTAEGAAVANDAGAAVGATTALKLANLTENASTAQEGVSEFATAAEIVTGTDDTRAVNVKQLKDSLVLDGMWLTKRTKMPDGAAVYSQDAFATADSWDNLGSYGTISVSGGTLLNTYSGTSEQYIRRNFSGIGGIPAGTYIYIRIKTSRQRTVSLYAYNGTSYVAFASLVTSTDYSVFLARMPVSFSQNFLAIGAVSATTGDVITVDNVWIGDYSYLPGSLSEEAARIADQLGDTPGVGVAASGTITSNGTNVTAGDTVTIAGKVYTFRDAAYWAGGPVEGDVLIGASASDSCVNLHRAILRSTPASYDGVYYKIAEAHPLVSSSYTVTYNIALTAKLIGILGNQITLAKSAATLTLSGSTLTGGKDAVGDKIHTQLQTMPATTSKYGAALLAADGGTTAGTVVQANDSRLAKAPVSWTPVPKFGGVNDDGTFAITANNSIQIGKFVHIEAVLTWTEKGSKTGTFTLTGAPVSGILPGTFKVIGSAYISIGGLNIPSALQVAFDGGSLVLISQAATGSSTITDANFTATTQIRIVGDYIAA